MNKLRYFTSSIWVTVIGLLLGAWVGYFYTGTTAGVLNSLFLVSVLSILEVSLSFDNAVVNAAILRNMTDLWRHRFLTWGMLIAVFGMRLIFPLALVGIVARVNPWEAIVLAATNPGEYARIMTSAHTSVAAFGGAFLLMVGLKYFFDARKEVHWIQIIEEPLTKIGRMEAIGLAIAMVTIYMISTFLPAKDAHDFLVAGIFGLVTFIFTDGIAALLEAPKEAVQDAHRASAGMFLYLEVLDASFSFDGVVGAFAITNNLFIIAIGLGIGAMFVRSLTILLVEQGTLTQYQFLEHGAFYAIGALAVIMFLNTFIHIPEAVTGLIGAAFIGISFWSSIRYNRKHAQSEHQVGTSISKKSGGF